MSINGPCSVDFSEFAFQHRVPNSHFNHIIILQFLDGLLKNRSRFRDAQELRHLCYIQIVPLQFFLLRQILDHSIIYFHCMIQQSILFFQFRIHQIEHFAILGRALLEDFLKHVATPLQPLAFVPLLKLINVHQPNIVLGWPVKQIQSHLEGLEALLEVLVLF